MVLVRILRFFVICLIITQLILPQRAAMPGWWTDDAAQTRIINSGATPSNTAPATLGQLKYVAAQAKKYLDLKLMAVGGAGNEINGLVASFEPRAGQNYTPEQLAAFRATNCAPINVGQLKAVAKPFYKRLLAVGYNSRYNLIAHGARADWAYDYPWNPTAPWNQLGAADKTPNYQMANLAQLKMAFCFDLASDTDGNFLPANLVGSTNSGMSSPNDPPDRLGDGGNTAAPPVYGTPSPGGGGAGPQTDPDHDPANPGNITQPQLWVAGGSYIDPDTGNLTPDSTTAHLEWDVNLVPTQQIVIQRRDGAANWVTVGTVGGGMTEYDDENRLANVSYSYRVAVTFTSGQTLRSNVAFYLFDFYKSSNIRSAYTGRINPGFAEYVPSNPGKFYLIQTGLATMDMSSQTDDSYNDQQHGDFTSTEKLNPIPDDQGNYIHTFSGSANYTDNGSSKGKNSQGQDSTQSWGVESHSTQNADGTWTGKRDWWNVDLDGNRTSGEDNLIGPSYGNPIYTMVPTTNTATSITGEAHTSGDGGSTSTDVTASLTLSDEYTPEQLFSDTIDMADAVDLTQLDWQTTDVPPTQQWTRIRMNDDSGLGIHTMAWKVDTYPSAPKSETWYLVFYPTEPLFAPPTDNPDLPSPEIVDTTTVTESGGNYEMNTGMVPERFQPGDTCGNYQFVRGLQVYAWGSLPDKSASGGLLPATTLDPQEMTSGSAIVHAPDSHGNGGVSGTVSMTSIGMNGETWTVTVSDGGGFTVIDSSGNIISGSQTYTYPQTLTVIPNATAGEGAQVTITISESAPIGSLGTEKVVFTNMVQGLSPKDYSVPLDEASGSRYRKISVTGRPLADEKPQQTAESDEEKEETYVDALTLGLHHTTTDVYVPVSGSDLTITARRDSLSEVWNMNNGLRPHERLDRPFGAGWSSNLCPYLETVSVSDGATYTYVVDQNGSRHRFIQVSNVVGDTGGYVPVPSDSRENGDYLTLFDGTTFTDRYGTRIVFNGPHVAQSVSTNRNENAGSESHNFTAPSYIQDRLGNKLTYTFPNNGSADGSTPNTIKTLIPSTIVFSGATTQKISIAQDGTGHVTSIWDPNGNRFDYTYQDKTYVASNQQYTEKVLKTVTGPDNRQTQYDYIIAVEADLTPNDITNGQKTDKLHLDLSSIADPNNNTYQITYGFDHTKFSYDLGTNNYYPETGAPSYVTNIQLPAPWGHATFSNDGSVTKLNPQAAPDGSMSLTADSKRQVKVTDAGNNTINYSWSDSHAFAVGGIYTNIPAVAIPKVVFYDTMDIDYGVELGKEEFTFDPAAGMALKSVKDLSLNTTTYSYDDNYSPALATIYPTVFPYLHFATKYPDPTVQTDAFLNPKTFHYAAPYQIMDSVLDEKGRLKTYQIDNLGRRTNEIIFAQGVGSAVVQETDFSYEDARFPGVVTTQTVKNLGGPDWGTDLVTQRQLDQNGRVAQETINPGGLGLTTKYEYDLNGNKVKVTDPKLHVTGFEYDTRNRLTRVVYADGSAKSIDYYDNGLKWHETDENLHQTTFEYDTLNRLTKQTRTVAAGDIVTHYGYDDAVKPKASVQDPNQKTTTFQYDGLLRLIKTTDPLGRFTQFDYSGPNSGAHAFDSSGFKPTTITDPRGYVTSITYDSLYRATAKSVQYQLLPNALFSNTSTVYDNVGNPATAVDPLGHATTTDFDALNRPTHVSYADGTETFVTYTSTGLKWLVQDELTRVTETQYDAAGRPVVVLEPCVDDGTGNRRKPKTKTDYDPAGNVAKITNPLNKEWTYQYDSRNRKIEEDQPVVTDAVSGQAETPKILTGYDYVGNVLWVQDARGFTTETCYDEANRPKKVIAPPVLLAGGTQAVRTTIEKTYDPGGNVKTVKDGNNHVVTNTYDDLNRLKTTTDEVPITVCYDYDEVGNRTSVKDGKRQQTLFAYDGLNRNTTTTDAAGKTITLAYNGLNKISRTDALSPAQVTAYGYDLRNRLKSVNYSARPADNRSYGYDATGHLQTVTEPGKNGAADVTYDYDELHRVRTETSNGATHHYTYNLAGNRLSVQYGRAGGGNGRLIVSSYDELNRLRTLTEGTRLTTYGYDLGGNVVAKTLPNGDAVTTHYDGLGRAYEEEGLSAQGILYHYLSLCDGVGNLRSSTEYTAGVAPRKVTMDYDKADRLTSEVITDLNGQPVSTTTYDYDPANNRWHKTANGVTATYSYNNLNQLTTWSDTAGNGASYGYDFNGNRVSRTVGGVSDVYTYDTENRLVGLAKNTVQASTTPGTYGYVYDYRTRRVARTETGATMQMVFSGGTSVQEYSAPGVVSAEYVRGSDWGGGVGGVLYSLRGGSASYDHYDRRGDVTARTDSTGTVTWQASYEAFGTRPAEYGTTQDRQKANTKEEDPTGLLNEGMRYRDLETGTFITRDPAGFIDGPNLYAYVRQNPWTRFDPEGLLNSGLTPVVTSGGVTTIEAGTAGAVESFAFAGALPLTMAVVFTVGIWGLKDHVPPPNGGVYVPPGACDCNSGYRAPKNEGHAFTIETQEDADAHADFTRLSQSDPEKALRALNDRSNEKSSNPDGESARDIQQGGSHAEMSKATGDKMDSHHMPSSDAIKESNLTRNEGPAIKMDPKDHQKTASWGSSKEAEAYRAKQAEFIRQGRFREAQQMDVKDIRSKFGNKYDEGIKQAEDYTRSLPPEKLLPK